MGYRDYSTAKGLIVDSTGHGDFTTITAAMAVATTGQTVFVRPGTYTENFTLTGGVNLCSFESLFSNVIINGKITYTSSASSNISGITLQTNSDYLLVNSGTGQVGIFNSTINANNHTGISSTGTGIIAIYNSNGNTATTGISIFTVSGGGILAMNSCQWSNTGNTTTASTVSSGVVGLASCGFNHVFSSSGAGAFLWGYSSSDCTGLDVSPVTFGGSGTQQAYFTEFLGGSAPAVAINSTANLVNCVISSSAGNAIAGSGTLTKAYLVFTSTSSTIAGTLTVATFPTA